MEGKNCFRTKWSQSPLYSGGNLATVYLPPATIVTNPIEDDDVTPKPQSAVGTLCMVTACESTCHLIDAATGNAIASFTIPTSDDDVILCVDAVTIAEGKRVKSLSSSAASAAVAASGNNDQQSENNQKKQSNKKSNGSEKNTSVADAVDDKKVSAETDEDKKFNSGAFDGTYVVFSTRQVQIYLLQVVYEETPTTASQQRVSLKLVRNWTASQHAISLVQFAKNGQWIVAGSTDGNVKVWNAFSFFLLHQLYCPHGVITCAALSPSNDTMAVGNFDGWITLFDMSVKRKIAGKRVHTSAVESILVFDDAATTRAAANGKDFFVSVARDRKISFVRFADASASAETSSSSSSALEERRAIVVLEYLTCAKFERRDTEDGSLLLHLGAQDGTVATYRVHPTSTVRRLCTTEFAKIRSAKKTTAAETDDAVTTLDEERAVRSLALPAAAYLDACFAAKSTALCDDDHPEALPVVADNDEDHASVHHQTTIRSGSTGVRRLTDVTLFAANASFNVQYLQQRNGKADSASPTTAPQSRYECMTTLVGFLDQILDVKLIPEPSASLHILPRLVVTNTKEVYMFDGKGGEGSSALSNARLEGHEDVVMCCAVTPDGRYAATGGKDRRVLIWDLSTFQCVAVGEGNLASQDDSKQSKHNNSSSSSEAGHFGDITNVHFNMKMDAESFWMLVSVGSDESIRFWDVGQSLKNKKKTKVSSSEEQQQVPSLDLAAAVNQAHDGPIHALSVSPNDQYIATGGKDKIILLWAVRGKKIYKEATLRGHRRGVTSLVFSGHDRIVASASNDGSVKIWSLASLSCVKTLQHDKVGVLALSFFNQSSQLVSSNAEGVLRIWALASSEVVSTQDVHDSKVWAIAVKENTASASTNSLESSLVIVSGSSTGTLLVTEDNTAEEAQRITEERHTMIYNEQQLQNAMRQKQFSDAFALALKLNHPRHLRQVVVRWSTVDAQDCATQLSTVIIPSLQDAELKRLISFVQDWASNARHSNVSSLVLEAFLNAFHYSESVKKHAFLKDALESLLSYSMRHSNRLHGMLHRTYFLQFLLREEDGENYSGGALTREPPQAAVTETVLGKMLLLNGTSGKRPREE